jgi:ADP-ribosylglycohydrolase
MGEALLDAVYGCLIGGAIGDALGAPVENWHYADIRERHGKVEHFMPQPARVERPGGGKPGMVTDDSTLRHYLCCAIADKGGRIGPDDYARAWLDKLNPDRLFITERIVLEKLKLGMSPWVTGRGQPLADAAIMCISPVGIINAGDPAQAYQDGYVLALIHQDGIECDAAATVAAGVAAAFSDRATVSSVLASMREHCSYEIGRLLEMASALAETSADPDHFVEQFYATLLDRSFPLPPAEQWDRDRSVSPTSREVLPAVAGLLQLCGSDANRCLSEAASFGRDADTIATVAGGLIGALHGARALRRDWIEQCEQANEDLFDEVEGDPAANFRVTAERLVWALAQERRAIERRLSTVDRLLGR